MRKVVLPAVKHLVGCKYKRRSDSALFTPPNVTVNHFIKLTSSEFKFPLISIYTVYMSRAFIAKGIKHKKWICNVLSLTITMELPVISL